MTWSWAPSSLSISVLLATLNGALCSRAPAFNQPTMLGLRMCVCCILKAAIGTSQFYLKEHMPYHLLLSATFPYLRIQSLFIGFFFSFFCVMLQAPNNPWRANVPFSGVCWAKFNSWQFYFSGSRIPDFYPNKAGSFLGYSGVLFLYYSTPLNFGLIDWDIWSHLK